MCGLIKRSLWKKIGVLFILILLTMKKKTSFPISVKFYARLLAVRFKSFIKEQKYCHIALLIEDLF